MEKTKKKTIEQSGVRKGSPMEGVGVYGGKDLRKRYLWSLEWKRVGVIDNDSGDDGTDEMSLDNSVEKSEKKNDQD